MLAFIDESGDSGFKIKSGSSKYFTISLVIFNNTKEALKCDEGIQLLKQDLKWNKNAEFHFKNNSDKIRLIFLNTVRKYNFIYYGFVLNKDENKLFGIGFKDKKSFYKYTCGLLFENSKSNLTQSTVIIDESGNLEFKRQLAGYLKAKINSRDIKYIKKVKIQKSSSNNLLQLADYIVGAINRSLSNKKDSQIYRDLVIQKEKYVQIWPR